MSDPLLDVQNLTTQFYTDEGTISAVDDISYTVETGDIVGIVGESGSGKSVSVRSLVRLIDSPGVIEAGRVYWKGKDVLKMNAEELRTLRGNEIAMVFQDPREALDPAQTVGSQIVEAVRAHRDLNKREARTRAIELLTEVGIAGPEEAIDDYPHEFSGGMAQRALVAMALASEPDLLIADEPTTGLDVTIQAQILDLLRDLQAERDMAIVMISHDLGVISELCERLIVMYAGRIVEQGALDDVLSDPKHPYTQLFLKSVPRIDNPGDLAPIVGTPPNLANPPSGCRFRDRCPNAKPICAHDRPPETEFTRGHQTACYAYTEAYRASDAEPRPRPEDPEGALDRTITDGGNR